VLGGVLDVDLFRVGDDFKIMETLKTGDGAFSMSYYCGCANEFYVLAQEDANHKGISAIGTPNVSKFDIVMSSSGGSAGSGSTTIVASNYAFIG
jgi:hypothetical protein